MENKEDYKLMVDGLKESNKLAMDLQIQLVQKNIEILDLKIGLREIMRLMNPCSEVFKKCKYLLG
jgi:hypothetical protein